MDRKPIRLIHITDARNRLAISRYGLRARFPRDHNYVNDPRCSSQPKGVYCTETTRHQWVGHICYPEVWKIDCSGLLRIPDHLVGRGWVILCDVPPERLTLVGRQK